MTECATPTAPLTPYDELLTALEDYTVGEMFMADSWRARADARHLTAAQVGAAQKRAIREGYLVPFTLRLPDGRRIATAAPSGTESRKGGRNLVYSRTSKALPLRATPNAAHAERPQCDGQTDLLDLVGDPVQ